MKIWSCRIAQNMNEKIWAMERLHIFILKFPDLYSIQFLLWKGLKLFTFLPSNSVIAYGWYAVIKKAKPHYYQVSSLLTPPSIRLGYEIIHWKMTLVDRLGRYSIHESAHIMSDHENTLLKHSKLPNKHENNA